MSEEKQAYPLTWPDGWKRTTARVRAKFAKTEQTQFGSRRAGSISIADGVTRVLNELRRLGANTDEAVISTNVRVRLDGLPRGDASNPSDPGVAVYWKLKGKQQCMAIDQYDRVADNLAAVAATLESLRTVARHGGGQILDRAFHGFAQLPASIVTQPPWRTVLKFRPNESVTMNAVEAKFRELAKVHHSDAGGNDDQMRMLIQARGEARQELGA